MDSMNSANIKSALELIARMLSSLSRDVSLLKAEKWALEEAAKEAAKTAPQLVFETVAAFRDHDTYRNTLDSYVLVASSVQEAVNKIRL
jgi:hypothetical protein